MTAGFKVTESELVEHSWLDNYLLDAQTTTTALATRPRPTNDRNTTIHDDDDDDYKPVLHPGDSQHHRHHHQQQQPTRVKSEHSYSLDDNNGGVDFNIKIEPHDNGQLPSMLVHVYLFTYLLADWVVF